LYPLSRLRRTRRHEFIRRIVAENHVRVEDLVYPVFVVDGENREVEIDSLPGQKRLSIDNLLIIAQKCLDLGIPGIALFPMIESPKIDKMASEAYNPDGLIPRAISALKQHYPNLGVFTDIALDAYTFDGHDGISDEDGYVQNDLTNEVLVKQALCHAAAGADFVCPSDMMDGRVLRIREALDSHGFIDTGIMVYSAKYASGFYGPFRDATGVATNLGKFGKQTYQMNPANTDEAIHEVRQDLSEGADIIMIKPGIPYLDVLYRVKQAFNKPTAAYHVSGEYALLKFGSQNGLIDYERVIMETMLCFKRAGADLIWTYAAIEVAELIAMHVEK
jgi:porphobilinogen synthase